MGYNEAWGTPVQSGHTGRSYSTARYLLPLPAEHCVEALMLFTTWAGPGPGGGTKNPGAAGS